MTTSRNVLLGAAIALASAGTLSSIDAQARTVIYATSEPPALRVETVPAPRAGYIWVNGNWAWSHNKYAWQNGHWARERHGYHYVPASWDRDGERWRYHEARWDH